MSARTSVSDVLPARGVVPHYPNNENISYSDFCDVCVKVTRARFMRPTVDSAGFQHASPGARVRFDTDATCAVVHLNYTNLIERPDDYGRAGLVLIDGVEQYTFLPAQRAGGPLQFTIRFPDAARRTIDLVLPYCASVDFEGIDLNGGASLSAAASRPATRYVAVGDSITQGFYSTGAKVWPYWVAKLNNFQTINHGYGGRKCVPADGTTLGNLTPSVATYLIGYNDFSLQTALAAFQANYKAFINNFRAINASAKLYCITPLWTPHSFGSLKIEDYREQIRDALTDLANPLNVLVEGLTLATNSSASFPDGVHPNNIGSIKIATALSALITN